MRKSIPLLSLAAVAVVGVVAYSFAVASVEGGSCPGKVVCPLTGDEVCKDQCPLLDARRAECPLTGEPVCSDACPLDVASPSSEPRGCLATESSATSLHAPR